MFQMYYLGAFWGNHEKSKYVQLKLIKRLKSTGIEHGEKNKLKLYNM